MPGFPVEPLAQLESLDPDDRLPIAAVHDLLRGAIDLAGDPYLGLRAARAITAGDYGALEYAVRSAPTWRDALAAVSRFTRLVNDALVFSLEVEGASALIHLDSRMVLPQAAAEFQSAAFYTTAFHALPCPVTGSCEVWFTHPAPERMEEYDRTFEASTLRFERPFNGFVFPSQLLEAVPCEPDPHLHATMQKHAELLLAQLPRAESLTEKVRALIARELSGGNPGVGNIAGQLHMSPSTLGRRLENEGTTFKELLDDLRQRLALRYMATSDLGLSEVALLLGFSQSTAFLRAFKRWTGQTPLEYRRRMRGVHRAPRT